MAAAAAAAAGMRMQAAAAATQYWGPLFSQQPMQQQPQQQQYQPHQSNASKKRYVLAVWKTRKRGLIFDGMYATCDLSDSLLFCRCFNLLSLMRVFHCSSPPMPI
jgi:hypothetical protein